MCILLKGFCYSFLSVRNTSFEKNLRFFSVKQMFMFSLQFFNFRVSVVEVEVQNLLYFILSFSEQINNETCLASSMKIGNVNL